MGQNDGLYIIYTGDGKGKTTASLGLIFRALGYGKRCCMVQFMKEKPERFGEYHFARSAGVSWYAFGKGFTWNQKDLGPSIEEAMKGWLFVQQAITDGMWDVLVLDEFTYPLQEGWLNEHEVVTWLGAHRRPGSCTIITGRKASEKLIALGDIVTDMHEIKHSFKMGIPAKKGIEY